METAFIIRSLDRLLHCSRFSPKAGMAWSLLLALRFVLVLQGVHALLPLSAGVHRAVDRLLLHRAGGHRRQLFGVLHHPLHRRSLCLPHLHHLHLRGSREAESPARETYPVHMHSKLDFLTIYSWVFSLLKRRCPLAGAQGCASITFPLRLSRLLSSQL